MTRYFDCNSRIGPTPGKDPATPWTVSDVLRSLDRCLIDGALVAHTLSAGYDPVYARDRLADELRGYRDRLFPVWSVLPPDAGDESLTPGTLAAALDDAGVRAIQLHPLQHEYPLDPDFIGEFLAVLERERTLVIVDFNHIASELTTIYHSLDRTLRAFPELPVLLTGAGWHRQRTVSLLMGRHPNLHLEFSSYQIHFGIEEYVARFGAERLLFGTGLPDKSAGAARAFIDYASIPQIEKNAIAGGNLVRLLRGLSPASSGNDPTDELYRAAAEGKPLPGCTVEDAHSHILHPGGVGAGRTPMYRGHAE